MTGVLAGRTAIVTGGSRGIGFAIAERFAAEGARVMLAARSEDDLRRAAGAIDGDVAWCRADVGEAEAASACVDATMDRFGSVDILVNNAAMQLPRVPLMVLDPDGAAELLRVNLVGPLVWTQCAWRTSMQRTGGNVINIGSIAGVTRGARVLAWYAMAKAALVHLTESLARELAPGVRVNAICPGIVKTEMSVGAWGEREAEFSATYPLQRLGEPSDIAATALFLASDAASWTTGTTLVVDGGVTLA
jgi:NAD(P)-dependent dehydrogenase (short-subunit alcohol dehydrogenase family)